MRTGSHWLAVSWKTELCASWHCENRLTPASYFLKNRSLCELRTGSHRLLWEKAHTGYYENRLTPAIYFLKVRALCELTLWEQVYTGYLFLQSQSFMWVDIMRTGSHRLAISWKSELYVSWHCENKLTPAIYFSKARALCELSIMRVDTDYENKLTPAIYFLKARARALCELTLCEQAHTG